MKLADFLVLLSLSVLTLTHQLAWSQVDDGPIYGSEFTFTNQIMIDEGIASGSGVIDTPANTAARDAWVKKVREKCPDCTIREGRDHNGVKNFKITHPNGFWFQISLDPWVVETQMKPMTLKEIRASQNFIEDMVFKTAAEVGIYPHVNVGGGHIHFDLQSTFKNDPLLFRNFFVDYHNHPELSLGALGNMPDNAPTLAVLTIHQRKVFQSILNRFDDQWYFNKDEVNIESFARTIRQKVYNSTFMEWTPPYKYQAINLQRVIDNRFPKNEKTIELRGLRPQRSVLDFVQMLELFQSRLDYLKKINTPIKYIHQKIDVDRNNVFNIPDRQKVVDGFYDYVTESGLPWNIYRFLLPWDMSDIKPSKLALAATATASAPFPDSHDCLDMSEYVMIDAEEINPRLPALSNPVLSQEQLRALAECLQELSL